MRARTVDACAVPSVAVAALSAGLLALAASGCGSSEGRSAKSRLLAPSGPGAAPAAAPGGKAPFEWNDPGASLRLGADEAAGRLGSFDWAGVTSWSASRDRGGPGVPPGALPARVQGSERHRVRQLAGGEFEVQTDVDPGLGPGSETGSRVIWANGMTYARSRYAPSGGWRERPTDRGRDARRFRDESFGAAGDVAALLGPALVLRPLGETTVLGRPARRFALLLDPGAFTPGPSHLGEGHKDGHPDEDTARRLAFLDGRVPAAVEGELVADAATGVPLELRLRAVFRVSGDPSARIDVDLSSRMTALGERVPPVEAPARALPDERKPRGVAKALEAAGLRGRKGPAGADDAPEPADETE